MIKTFKHKGLKELFEKARTARIDAKLHTRVLERLDALNRAPNLQALDLPGFNTHPLKQFKPLRYSIWVTGAWRITFEFDRGDADRVDLEQYH
jgi:toxin HigB-1